MWRAVGGVFCHAPHVPAVPGGTLRGRVRIAFRRLGPLKAYAREIFHR